MFKSQALFSLAVISWKSAPNFFKLETVLLIFVSCSGSESADSSILSENLSSQDSSSNETSSGEENNQSDAGETATNQSEGNQTEN